MAAPRRQRLQPEPRGPDWLERLKMAIFTVHPEIDHDATWQGEPSICKRSLLPMGAEVRYHETYLDPRTYEVQKAWHLDIESAAFVGRLPADVFTTHASLVLRAIQERQEALRTQPRQGPMSHERFVEWVTGRGTR